MSNQTIDKMSTPNAAERASIQCFAPIFRAYMEASDEVQQVVKDMCDVINDSETDHDEAEAAIVTLVEALFPASYDGELGIGIDELRARGYKEVSGFAELMDTHDAQEDEFAKRLERIMGEKGLTQTNLAELAGVQQPAISMMLRRKCRPQKRTVIKLAIALEVSPKDLWPNFQEDGD